MGYLGNLGRALLGRAASAYETTGNGRKSRALRVSSLGPNAALDYTADALRNQSRDLVRKDVYARAVVRTIVKHTVGTGITPQIADPAVAALWWRWVDEAAVAHRANFYSLQAQVMRALVEGGDCFVRLRVRRPGDMATVPLQLQVLEAEFVPNDKNEMVAGGGQIRQGIEFDAIGRVAAYWMYRRHPADNDPASTDVTPVRVPASEVIHLSAAFDERPGQVRGEPWMVTHIATLRQLHDYLDAELERKEKAAKLVGAIRQNVPEGMSEDELAQAWGEQYELSGGVANVTVESGSLPILDPGQDIEFFDTPDAGSNFEAFVAHYQRAIATGAGLLYEQVSGDYAKVNDRMWRAAFNEFRRGCEMWQHHILVHQLCRVVLARWEAIAKLNGLVPEGADLSRTEWTPPRWPYINPQQDIAADRDEIRAGLASRAQKASERGQDVTVIDAENAADNARSDGLGLVYDTDPRRTSRGGQTQARAAGSEIPETGGEPGQEQD